MRSENVQVLCLIKKNLIKKGESPINSPHLNYNHCIILSFSFELKAARCQRRETESGPHESELRSDDESDSEHRTIRDSGDFEHE